MSALAAKGAAEVAQKAAREAAEKSALAAKKTAQEASEKAAAASAKASKEAADKAADKTAKAAKESSEKASAAAAKKQEDLAKAAKKKEDDAAKAAKKKEDDAIANQKKKDDAVKKKENDAAAAQKKKDDAAKKKQDDADAAAKKKQADADAKAKKKQDDIDAKKKLDDDMNNPNLAKKFEDHPKTKSYIQRNPTLVAGLTIAGIAALAFGAVVAARAAELMKLNDKVFMIVSMTNPDTTNPTYVQVTYTPETEIPIFAMIRISESVDIQPQTIIEQESKIEKIISKTQLEFIIPSITTLATSGEFRLRVELDDCLNEAAKDTVNDVTTPVKGLFSDMMGGIGKIFGAATMYILGFVALIVVFFIIFLIRKLMKLFGR
jgi:DNA polymerase III alpha subunit (gram-positive type)